MNALWLVWGLAACVAAPQPAPAPSAVEPTSSSAPEPASRLAPSATPASAPAPKVVAIGDVHGDLRAAREALQLGGVVDDQGHWIGGTAVAVQVGDVLDRGDDERAILDWFEALVDEAARAGGRFVPLLGNHELMNVAGDLRYVTAGGYAAFADVPSDDPALAEVPPAARGRVAAFRPGGVMARRLASHPVALIVGDTAFVHGGLLPQHAAIGLPRLDREASRWMTGEAPMPPWAMAVDGPLWTRAYSQDPPDCATLDRALAALGVARMVVAHTPQPQVNSACAGKVWRVDVGMARAYGGKPAAWVLEHGVVRIATQAASTSGAP